MADIRTVLLNRIEALCHAVPPTDILKETISKGIQGLSSREGYEILRFLAVTCGNPIAGDPGMLKSIGGSNWRNLHCDIKANTERLKIDILQAVKHLLQRNQYGIKPLWKSDLLAPSSVKFLSCCLYLAELAIDHRLRSNGITISENTSISEYCNEFFELYNCLKEQEMELDNKSKLLNVQIANYFHETMNITSEINDLRKSKYEINSIIQEVIDKCPVVYKDLLGVVSTFSSTATRWSNMLDDLNSRNMNKISILKELDEALDVLKVLTNNGFQQSFIDGNSLASLISNDLVSFLCEMKIDVVERSSFNLLALLHILLISIPQHSIKNTDLDELTMLKCPYEKPDLSGKFLTIAENLEFKIADEKKSLENSINVVTAAKWLQEFFITIPVMQFSEEFEASFLSKKYI